VSRTGTQSPDVGSMHYIVRTPNPNPIRQPPTGNRPEVAFLQSEVVRCVHDIRSKPPVIRGLRFCMTRSRPASPNANAKPTPSVRTLATVSDCVE
jgi:hypothetical protein